jgi:uracil-DNA glycosylase
MERGWEDVSAAEVASLVGWWQEAGVDCVVTDEPRNWLAPSPPPAPPLAHGGVEDLRRERSGTALRLGGAAGPARASAGRPEIGKLPDQLPLFQEWLRTSDALPYAAPSAPRICPAGDPASGLMIVVAMPSAEDCAAGVLLSGSAGRLFDRMLAAIGRSREAVYLAGLSCLRPAAGRLDPAGAGACADIARHHVGLVGPKAVLLMGDECCKALLGTAVAPARGKVHSLATPAGAVAAIATFSPDHLLRQPAAKARAWADLQLLMDQYR